MRGRTVALARGSKKGNETSMSDESDIQMTVVQSLDELRTTQLIEEADRETIAPGQYWPKRFRPTIRPPQAVVRIFDDNLVSAENIRVRQSKFVIGRESGDLVVPHDGQMSSRHAQIELRSNEAGWTWHLLDLASTNGTYVRVQFAKLKPKQRIRLGQFALQFMEATKAENGDPIPARLLCVSATGRNEKVLLEAGEYWLGCAPQCPAFMSHDEHARRETCRRLPTR